MIIGAILQTAAVDYAMMLVARVVTGEFSLVTQLTTAKSLAEL